MRPSEVYVRELDLSHEPNLSKIEQGSVTIEFEVIGNPEYNQEIGRLCGDFRISISMEENRPTSDDTNKEIGSIDVEVTAALPGEKEELESYIQTWKEDGYHRLPDDVRFQIESSFTRRVFSPVSGLVDNSFQGVLPGVMFSGENIEIDEENKENIESEIENKIKDIDEISDSNLDIDVDIGEFWRDSMSIKSDDEELKELIRDNKALSEEINEIVTETLFKNAPEKVTDIIADDLDVTIVD